MPRLPISTKTPMNNELVIDEFAGGGGASTGIALALGRSVDIAINHDGEALALHRVNHPTTKHYCEDVWAVDPCEATHGRPVGLMWASPDCCHHSRAKGGKPLDNNIRGLAWVIIKWAQLVKPRVIMMENVPEWIEWGPLLPNNRPDLARKGETRKEFVEQLEAKGYEVDWRELRGCDYGSPTIRKRLFLIARCDGAPIVWPEPTHGKTGSPDVLSGKLKPWRQAWEHINFTLPTTSIFEKKYAEASMERVAKGLIKYVIEAEHPFIIPQGEGLMSAFLTEHANASHQRNFSVEEPLRTQCAQVKGGHFAQVVAFMAKHYTGVVGSSLEEPLHTITGTDHNALVSAHLVRQFGNSVGSAATDPLGTITAGGQGKTALVTSHLEKFYSTAAGADIREPLPTITSGGNHIAEVRAYLVKYYGSGGQDQDITDPLHTITSKGRIGLVTVHGEDYQIVDIRMRMLQPRELYDCQGFPHDYIIDLERNGKRLSKAAQVRLVGNSVCPQIPEALVKANVPEMCHGEWKVAV